LPALEATEDLSRWLPHSGAGLKLVVHHAASQTFADLSRPAGEVTLLIGPEGGLSEAEREAAQRAGFIPVRFGPRVLRTETAALAALAVLQVHWGDLRG
jgi:16S rRNA (uracil1498-N3)-methyltransferase